MFKCPYKRKMTTIQKKYIIKSQGIWRSPTHFPLAEPLSPSGSWRPWSVTLLLRLSAPDLGLPVKMEGKAAVRDGECNSHHKADTLFMDIHLNWVSCFLRPLDPVYFHFQWETELQQARTLMSCFTTWFDDTWSSLSTTLKFNVTED